MDFAHLVVPALLNGAKFTVTIAIQAGILSILISIVVGVLRQYNNLFLKIFTGCYVEFFRGTSAFVQIYWAYFALPMNGVKLSAI